jgi:hydrogenase maturation factor
MAREREAWALALLGEVRWRRCARLLYEPGISVVPEALAAATAGAHALHDPTEGGLLTGLHELADAASVGLEIDLDAVPYDPDGRVLCEAAGIDPLGALASGALLIVGPPGRSEAIEAAVNAESVDCSLIGEVKTAGEGRVAKDGQTRTDLTTFEVDEIARWFEGGPDRS